MPDTHVDAVYDPNAIFDEGGPIDPQFMTDAIQTLMRALPLDTKEPEHVKQRRCKAALTALAATNPRDPIEVMLAVQAIAAYHAACACWRIGMNARHPRGDSTRHISAAATAARTFDTMLRAIERRQAKPLAAPVGRPASRSWPKGGIGKRLEELAERVVRDDDADPLTPQQDAVWSAEAIALAEQQREQDRIADENKGLDIANTEGILPDGGIIMPEDPTPQQEAYIGRRLGLMYKREYEENLRKGLRVIPKIRPLRTGDVIP